MKAAGKRVWVLGASGLLGVEADLACDHEQLLSTFIGHEQVGHDGSKPGLQEGVLDLEVFESLAVLEVLAVEDTTLPSIAAAKIKESYQDRRYLSLSRRASP